MYTDSSRANLTSHRGETDIDKKMRMVGDTNRRADRQLAKQLKGIDQHLQANLRQINGDMEIKSSSTSPTLSSPSPQYFTSSTDSSEYTNYNKPVSQRFRQQGNKERGSTVQNENKTRKQKVQSSADPEQTGFHGKDMENRLMQTREKTFTIIDHALLTDAESVTDNYGGTETKTRPATLDALDNDRLIPGNRDRHRKANFRNEKVRTSTLKNRPKASRSEYAASSRVSLANNRGLGQQAELQKLPGRKTDTRQLEGRLTQTQVMGARNPDSEEFTYVSSESTFRLKPDKNNTTRRSKIPTANSNVQILAQDEHNRRQLRKMHILSNLNKRHMGRDGSNDEILISREEDVRLSRNFANLHQPQNIEVEPEKPRPKSAMFSSQRRPRFTSEEDDNVFMDDLDIIDIDDDGESSDDEDFLGSSFVAPLKPSSRHRLGLHTRSTSDISPLTFRHTGNAEFRSTAIFSIRKEGNEGKTEEYRSVSKENSDRRGSSESVEKIPRRKSVIDIQDLGVDSSLKKNDEINGSSVDSTTEKGVLLKDTNNSFKRKEKRDSLPKGKTGGFNKSEREPGRAQLTFPRKLKPIFQPENVNKAETAGISSLTSENNGSDTSNPSSPKDTRDSSEKVIQRSPSNMSQSKKLNRARQRTWTAGVGPSGSRDLKRPMAPPNSKPRLRSDVNEISRAGVRRRARTSSELKKCSAQDLDNLKTGGSVPSQLDQLGNTDTESKSTEVSDSLRNCRYLRTNSEADSANTVNVESC